MSAAGTKDGGEDDDTDLFRRALADAAPLKRRRPQPVEKKVAAAKPKPARKAAGKKTPAAMPAASPRPITRPAPPPDIAAGDTAGVDRRTAERFRRGKLPIEGRLDLHGLYQDAAHDALTGFITESAARGRRCVLVITGRGSREGSGVLRARLPQWLNQAPCRAHVLAFNPARPEHGRDGAFYVLLRRRREGKRS